MASIVVVPVPTGHEVIPATGGLPGPKGDKGNPGSPGEGYLSRALMQAAAANATDGDDFYETETGGKWVFRAGDHSAHVTADPTGGVYRQAGSIPAATGALVRQFSGMVNVLWFGAKPDWNGTTGTDNGAAFMAALNFINATSWASGYGNGNFGLYIPKGRYNLNVTTMEVRTTIIIKGDGVGEIGGVATELRWAAGTTGIRIQESRTVGDTGSQTQDNTKTGAATLIQKLCLTGSYNGSNDADFHGIQLRARASIRDCWIENFQGDGIHINATSTGTPEGNANNFEVYKVALMANRNGLFTQGADVNAGVIMAADAMYNRQWGFNDNSFLGNTYVGCHTATNGAGPYQSTNFNARNVFMSCYSEGDQSPSQITSPAMVIGGLHAAGVTGNGGYIRTELGSVKMDNLGATNAGFGSLDVASGASFQSGASTTYFAGYNGGSNITIGGALNFGGNYRPGLAARNFATGPVDLWMTGYGLLWVNGNTGYGVSYTDGTGINLLGTGYSYQVNGVAAIDGNRNGSFATVKTSTYTVATLPSGVAGLRTTVTDSSVPAAGNFGAAVAGGGANTVPVYHDGGGWKIG